MCCIVVYYMFCYMEKLKAKNDGERSKMWLVNYVISFFLTIYLKVKIPVTEIHVLEIL